MGRVIDIEDFLEAVAIFGSSGNHHHPSVDN